MNSMAVDPTRQAPAHRGQHVLVTYESSADGQAALTHALGIARAGQAALTILAVVPHETENVGCARCRGNAAMWNHELGTITKEELAEAASIVGKAPKVEYQIARGPRAKAISEAASRCGVDLIVLPWRRPGHIRRLFTRDLAELLGRSGRWQVVVAPGASGKLPVQKAPGLGLAGSR